jgi:hypothetical protein
MVYALTAAMAMRGLMPSRCCDAGSLCLTALNLGLCILAVRHLPVPAILTAGKRLEGEWT